MDPGSPEGAGLDQATDEQLKVPAKMVGALNVRSTGLLKSWKNRWYELRGRSLFCFKTSGSQKPHQWINLESGCLSTDEPLCSKLRFTIMTGGGKVTEFQALNEEEYAKWVQHLKRACGSGGDAEIPNSTSMSTHQSPRKRLHESLVHMRLFDDERKPVTIDDFQIISEIGKGSYGRVLKVKKRGATGEDYLALKVMRKEAIAKPKEVMSERAVLQNIDHPFIVKLINAFQTPSKLFLVLTYLPGGDLKKHLREGTLFKEEKAKFYAGGILLALEHLHSCQVIYRDLKPENIVLDEVGYPVLTDMGLARELLWDPVAYTFCGTPLYVAPEVLKNKGYTKAVDWWSYGVILYELLLGITPFAAQTAQAVFQLIMSKAPAVPTDLLSSSTCDLLVRLLVKEPRSRLSDPSEIKGHPFFSGIDWQKYLRRQYMCPGGAPKRARNSSVKLDQHQIQEILSDFKEPTVSTRHRPETFQGFTFFGDGKDTAPTSPVVKRGAGGGYQSPGQGGSHYPSQQHHHGHGHHAHQTQHQVVKERGRPHH
eukprot:TRINITY_DN929_c0_g1_i1.p1 TRINITY_DN929_c0_g1~~TRINITY_DN929_c0_g1_i1.p1  ORF type:complete len:538 (+),score=61.26 TRINITY_DN929_c0_g1_i1:41-1654(+)